MQRDPYWKGRLERWQLWVFTAPGGAPPVVYRERIDCANVYGTLTPAINDEAIVTDELVAQLPGQIKAAVKAVYLDGVGNSQEGIAARLRISKRTLHERLCFADLRLDQALQAREQSRRRQPEQRISQLS